MNRSLAGIDFTLDDDQWEATRDFPFWRGIAQYSHGDTPAGVRRLSIPLPGNGRPTAAQQAALSQFLEQEEAIAARVLEALLRWLKQARKDRPDWFEDVSIPRSVTGLGKLIDLTGIHIGTEEVDGIATIQVDFSCDWDVEHGSGVLLWNGQVLDCGGGGGGEPCPVSRSGSFSKVCNDAERAARQRYMEVHPSWEQQAGLPEDYEQRMKAAQKKVMAAAKAELPGMLGDLRGGVPGVEKWNKRGLLDQINAGPYRKLDLSDLVLDGVEILENDFGTCNFDRSSFLGADLRKTKFKSCTFRNAVFSTASQATIQLASANLDGSDFSGAQLGGVDFSLVSLKKSVFSNADLTKSTFTFCKLQGADFSETTVSSAHFMMGCEYNSETKFPVGFDPSKCIALEKKR